MRRLCLLLSAVLMATLLGPMALPAAAAQAKPSVAFGFLVDRVDQNTSTTIRVSAKKLPARTTLYVQRQFGTKRIYKNITKAPTNGTVTLPGVPIGKYAYRVVAVKKVSRHGTKTVAVSRARVLYSYGPVSVAQLCQRTQHTSFGSCSTGTDTVGSQVFSYSAYNNARSGPDGSPGVIAQQSSCRSAHLEFAVGNDSADDDVSTVGVALYQEGADMLTATSPSRQVGVADFPIGSPAWNLVFWTETESGWPRVRWRGTLSCYTTSGDA